MSRVQLALNVSNLDEAIEFYSMFFKTQPAKVRPGYANFAISEPPLKLVLFEGVGEPGTINHLGVEVMSTDEVVEATSYLVDQGMAIDLEEGTTCCHALQDKVWVQGPDESRWEVYTVLADVESTTIAGDGRCCASADGVCTDVVLSAPACC
jgi:lactoylglutathione lyase